MRAGWALVGLALACGGVQAQQVAVDPPDAGGDAPAAWSFLATGFWNMPRQEGNYGSGIFAASIPPSSLSVQRVRAPPARS